MKSGEIRSAIAGMDAETVRRDLQRRVDDLYQELFNLRFQWSTRQLKNSNRLTQVKRDIARMKTIMREKELEAGRDAR
jgi:large subunit ribosomal protein L29